MGRSLFLTRCFAVTRADALPNGKEFGAINVLL